MKEFAVRELTLGQVFDASVEAFPLREAVVHPGTGAGRGGSFRSGSMPPPGG